jgi:hypothetical protein
MAELNMLEKEDEQALMILFLIIVGGLLAFIGITITIGFWAAVAGMGAYMFNLGVAKLRALGEENYFG